MLLLEHVGSTSVPGLAAKPIIDILLVLADPANEPSWLPPLEHAGYRLVIREPDWYQHRALKGPDTDINLHVHPPDSPEIGRHLMFRDWLRNCPDDLRRERIRARPAWRSRDIEEQVEFGRWLRRNIADHVDTSRGTPADAATAIAAWMTGHITPVS